MPPAAAQGREEDAALDTPESLRQLIEQQCEQLGPEQRQVLEVASVVGVEFSAAAVAAGIAVDVVQVEERGAELARRHQFLQTKGIEEWPDDTVASRYSFIHALYQDVIYSRVTGARRVRLHQRIGERKEEGYREQADEIAAELAVHFEEGRDYSRATQYLYRAGKTAIQRSAHQEAISLLTKGLALLTHLPDTPERVQSELAFHIALGVPLIATKGLAASEVEDVYTRALDLCQQVGETPQLFPGLWGSWVFYEVRGKLHTARELAARLLRLAQSAQDPGLLLEAHHALWFTAFMCGELASARTYAEQGMGLYDRRRHHSLAFLYGGHDPGVCCRDVRALVLWLLGYPDQAAKTSHDALTLAQELSHPFSLAEALGYATWFSQFCREGQAVHARTTALLSLSREQETSYWLAQATILHGWALTQQGHGEEGIAEMRRGLSALRATGTEAARPYYLALLAEACGKVGQITAGLGALSEALEAVTTNTGVHFYEAELYRLKGQLVLQSGVRGPESETPSPQPLTPSTQAEAEACFLKAIDIAQKQQAKSLEMRATMGLARLWQQQGKQKKAYKLLAKIYGWFTEGFDTKDLQEAKALLEELKRGEKSGERYV